MRKTLCVALLLFVAATALAEAGQFRISRPGGGPGRRPRPGHRDAVLEITNDDDQGYAIDVDYRRNRLTFARRDRGDIYVPGNSRISLAFDDDDDWSLEGDHESLRINMRDGRTTRLRLESRGHRNQFGLFGTVDDGRRRETKQLFRYHDRPGRPGGHRPPSPPSHRPPPPPPSHRPPPPPPPSHRPPPPPPGRPQTRGESLGEAIGGFVESLVDDNHRRR